MNNDDDDDYDDYDAEISDLDLRCSTGNNALFSNCAPK